MDNTKRKTITCVDGGVEKRGFSCPLLEMSIGEATRENRSNVPQKIKNRTMI